MKNWYFLVLVFSLAFGINAQVTKEIKGNLVDMKTSYDVEKVELSLTATKTGKVWTTNTNNDGEFTFKNIPLGDLEISIIDKDYRSEKFKFHTDSNHLQKYHFSTPFGVNLKVSWMFNWGDRTLYSNGKKIVKEHYWSHVTAKGILILYGLCLLLIFYYLFKSLSWVYI